MKKKEGKREQRSREREGEIYEVLPVFGPGVKAALYISTWLTLTHTHTHTHTVNDLV